MEKVWFKERSKRTVEKIQPGISPVIRFFIQLSFLIISFFLIFNSFRAFQIANTKLAILKQAQQEVTDLRLKNIQLILEKGKIETDDYVETDIRNRLNYSKSNEIIFVISDFSMEEAENVVKAILYPPVEKPAPKEIWRQWVDFFINKV